MASHDLIAQLNEAIEKARQIMELAESDDTDGAYSAAEELADQLEDAKALLAQNQNQTCPLAARPTRWDGPPFFRMRY